MVAEYNHLLLQVILKSHGDDYAKANKAQAEGKQGKKDQN